MRLNFLSVAIIALVAFSSIGCGDKSSDSGDVGSYSIAEEHVKVWDIAIEQVMELVDSMPETQLNYRPDDTIRTFAEQLVHIGMSSEMITGMFLKDKPRPEKMPEVNAAEMTKDELKAFVRERLENARTTIASMSNEQLLNEKVTSYMNHEMSRLEGLMFAHDHLTNHKAKANLYIRLVGQRPPHYRYY